MVHADTVDLALGVRDKDVTLASMQVVAVRPIFRKGTHWEALVDSDYSAGSQNAGDTNLNLASLGVAGADEESHTCARRGEELLAETGESMME